ncbi:MAG: formate--tetrahydrofolate ligase [Puniceicoccales bacterium]|nr:formate--tetrahydrofolate ligase [Puniceicoccales bacterium]
MKPIVEIAKEAGINPSSLIPYGTDKAKVPLDVLNIQTSRRGRLVLVSALTPTPAGEGKTVTSIGLAQGIRRLGKKVALALRQPSMGPVFGRKGGATGGGASTVQPATDINLHFTGDFHAITAAHNLLAAVLDNQLHFKQTRLAPDKVLWRRALDVNDRALRELRLSTGTGDERTGGFDITAASEIMAIICLANSEEDLRARLNRLVVGFAPDGSPVTAGEFRITGSLMALLRDALLPNLVQSAEGVPTFIHGGPFANIAHGCNSVLATRMALAHADYAVTEAGFAFDLGGEKFIDIKCRQSGLAPDAIVIVATVRALKMHGGANLEDAANSSAQGVDAVLKGLPNLIQHVEAALSFERPVIVAINRFANDTEAELAVLRDACAAMSKSGDARQRRVFYAESQAFEKGGSGAEQLAETVLQCLGEPTPLQFTYPEDVSAKEKIEAIAKRFYGAAGVAFTPESERKLALFEEAGFARLPVCVAKTQNSLSDDPTAFGRPTGFTITVRDVELAAGAGFLIALTGKMTRMPALPRIPAAEKINLRPDGVITGISGT